MNSPIRGTASAARNPNHSRADQRMATIQGSLYTDDGLHQKVFDARGTSGIDSVLLLVWKAILMTTNNGCVRILVADDFEPIRSSLRCLLESHPNWIVCGEVANGTDAVSEAIRLRPDVILVDVSMPDMNGFEAASRIHERLPASEILIVTEHDSRSFAHIGPNIGIRGYVMKSRVALDLISAVEAASEHRPLTASVSA
jgi:CheY-like chemotaxis protein